MTRTTCCLLLTCLAAAGCSAPPPQPQRQNELTLPPPLDHREQLEFSLAYKDIERDDRGDLDPVELARWVTERRNAADRAIKETPARLLQAVEILSDVARRVPDSSFVRQRLGQCLFNGAAIWFRNADATAWSIDNLLTTGQLPNGEQVTDDARKQQVLQQFRDYLAKSNGQVRAWSDRALQEVIAYRGMRPDDKGVLDMIWKLYFYLQNYDEALKFLDAVLREMEVAEVSDKDPLYLDYSRIRQEIVDYIAQLRIDSSKPSPRSLIPSLTKSREDH